MRANRRSEVAVSRENFERCFEGLPDTVLLYLSQIVAVANGRESETERVLNEIGSARPRRGFEP